MRYMIIVKATHDTEAGVMPEEPLLVAMAGYHEALMRAGVLLDASGPNPSGEGADAEVEVRQLFELDDFAPGEAIDRFRAMDAGAS